MTDTAKVVSLRYVEADGTAVDYVMIEGEDIEKAIALATRWAVQNVSKPYKRIEKNHGVMDAPIETEVDGHLDGARVWNLPF